MSDAQKWLVFSITVGAAVLFYLLAPVLTPFLVGAALAYIGDPLVDRLETMRLSRTWSVVVVFSGLLVTVAAVLLLLLPLLQQQIVALVTKLPAYLDWIQRSAWPWLQQSLGLSPELVDFAGLKAMLTEHWQQVGGVAANVLGTLSRSGLAMLAWLANLVLIPLVTFYLLRDWDVLVRRIGELFPRRMDATVARLARDCDGVLGAFLRGQLTVMLALGTVYSVGLWLVGLELALLIGLIAGLVSFVPYLGFILGVLLAGVAAVMQFHDVMHVLLVLLVFGIGQALESFVLTPLLLGDRIGLHPLGVIFAIMAGGQLFGFVGVLVALPTAAVIMVMLRYAHERYLDSRMYADPE